MIETLGDAGVIFVSLVLQSLPFILIGVLASAAVQVYLSAEHVARWLPSGRIPVILMGGTLGMVVPACDCGAVPVARRLVAKGVPAFGAVAFILAAPVVNPIVIATTAVAFQGDWEIVGMRIGLSFLVAISIGLLGSFLFANPSSIGGSLGAAAGPMGSAGAAAGAADDDHAGPEGKGLVPLLAHAADDFLDVIPYFIVGAFVAALIQTGVPRAFLTEVGSGPISSVLLTMPLGSLLSICSQADAFIARTFAPTFTTGSIIAFMVIGQVIDLRNGPLLLRTLGPRYVLLIIVTSYTIVFVAAQVINLYRPVLEI